MTVQEWGIVVGACASGLAALAPWMFMVHAKLAVMAAQFVRTRANKVEKATEANKERLATAAPSTGPARHARRAVRPHRRTAEELEPMKIRDRIQGTPPREGRPSCARIRTTGGPIPTAQQDALRGVLAEIGYADALLARELPDGSLELIDGHLRAETTPDAEVPVLVRRPRRRRGGQAAGAARSAGRPGRAGPRRAGRLLEQVETENEAVRALLDEMLADAELPPDDRRDDGPPPEVDIPEAFQVVVECRDEAEQQARLRTADRRRTTSAGC